jgi:hypothetical protein
VTSPLRDHAHSDTLDADFDLTDGGDTDFVDGPTELPPPWSPPRDSGFMTGTLPSVEPADLDEGLVPGVEPSDSAQATARLSREMVRELVAARIQAQAVSGMVSTHAAVAAALVPHPPVLPRRETTADPVPPYPVPLAVPPGAQVVIAFRWQLHHIAFAFAIGVLAGALTCILAMG